MYFLTFDRNLGLRREVSRAFNRRPFQFVGIYIRAVFKSIGYIPLIKVKIKLSSFKKMIISTETECGEKRCSHEVFLCVRYVVCQILCRVFV